jgi:hypothetical protein
MRQILTIVSIYILAVSCGQITKKMATQTRDQLHREFLDVMLDSTDSWKQVTDVVYPFVDSLCAAAVDETSLGNRMYGQEWGYVTIEALSEKYVELKDAGKTPDYDDVSKILEQIAGAMMLWFYTPDKQVPNIWRDHYYVCHQHSEEPTNGYFHLMVTLPTEDDPEPTLRIFYPDSAEGSPMIVFSKYKEGGGVEEDEDSRNIVRLENWSPKDSIEDGFPMYAIGDASVVDKMLQNDVAYLLFESGTSPNGAPGETEIARLSLDSFQKKWKDTVY